MATNLIALDVGEQRVGVALVRDDVRIATTLPTLDRPEAAFWDKLEAIVEEYKVETIVVGLPRGIDGQQTAQTQTVEAFGDELVSHLSVAIAWQDEALTSREAERLLKETGRPYTKGDIDAQAARLILEDYLADHPKVVKQ